jgi:hypothetical protein
MARKVTPAQYKAMVDKYNREAKRHNQKVNQQINKHNQEVKKHNADRIRQIDNYNREVNAQREKHRQQLNQAIRKFNNSRTVSATTTVYYRESVQRLENDYTHLENRTDSYSNYSEHQEDLIKNYPAQEANNSVQLFNSLNGIDNGEYINPDDLQKTYIESKLNEISIDMGSRWRGALFSLNPDNPDAGRHFCTSVREVYTQILEIKAPDEMVQNVFPDCELYQGKPNRRFKIKYILTQKSLQSESFENFVDSDIDELLSIFRTLNDGTHGSAGRFTIQQLSKLKKRVEDSINFIAEL